jgi:hypothetical protein
MLARCLAYQFETLTSSGGGVMPKIRLTPDQAVEEAVALLLAGPKAPREIHIRQWVRSAIREAHEESIRYRLSIKHRESIESIQKAASSLLKALEDLDKLEPWVVDMESDELCRMYQLLPIGDLDRLEGDLKILSTMGPIDASAPSKGARFWSFKDGPFGGRVIRLQLPAKNHTRPRLPDHILSLHQKAHSMLVAVGIPPAMGTGGSVANLGSLLCSASGVILEKDESTRAARLAKNDEERFAYIHGRPPLKHASDENDPAIPLSSLPWQRMETHCVILPKRDTRLNKLNSIFRP